MAKVSGKIANVKYDVVGPGEKKFNAKMFLQPDEKLAPPRRF